MGGDWTGGREDITGMGMAHLTDGSLISPYNPQYVPGVQMGGSEASNPSGDYVYRQNAKKPIRFYEFGGDIKPLDEDGNERQMPKLDTANSIITNNKRSAMTSEEAAMYSIDSANAVSTFDWFKSLGTQTTDGVINVFENLKKKVTGSDSDSPPPKQGATMTTDDGVKMKFLNDAWIPDKGSGNVETYQLNLKGKKGKSSASKDYVPEGTKKNGKYLHYTEEGPKWLDDPLGVSFEQEASEGTVKPFASGYEYIKGQGWTYKGGVPAAPTVKEKDKKNWRSRIQDEEDKKIIKLPSRSIEQISTSDLEMELQKAAPFELRGNSDYYTTEIKGKRGGSYVKGDDGKSEMNLRDQAGRLVWSGTQAEYQEKYGDFLEQGTTQSGERRKDRLYLKEYGGDTGELDSLKMKTLGINMMPTDNPTWTPIDPDSGTVTVNLPEKSPKFLLNKNGWADVDEYRKKAKDSKFIKGTQDLVITDGFDIDNDGVWGNKTYNAINQDLVNKQLNNYTKSNFTEDQFTAQIYKESTGDNSVVSGAGAMGIAQFLPSTFKWAKEKGWIPETSKITDVAAQSLAQRRYMDYLYEDRDNIKSAKTSSERQARTFASYNMGPGNFDKFWKKLSKKEKAAGWGTWYKKMNNETKMYVLWNMDRATYKKDYSTPYKNTRGVMTSKWNDVNYGFNNYKNKKLKYRY